MDDQRFRLFALDGSEQLGARVAAALGIEVAPCEIRPFEFGEHKARPLVSVRGRDAYVLHSLHGDERQSANDKLCRLLFFAGALRDAGAARVTAVTPYLCYSRKDRRTKPRDPVTTRYVAQLFEAAGIDHVVTLDVHNVAAFQNAFRRPTENLEARHLFVRYVAPLLEGADAVVVSPDAGGVKRAERLRSALAAQCGRDVPMAFVEKYRSGDVVSGDALVGDVSGRAAIIVDDMIASGTTLARAAQACRRQGATAVYAAATHAAFTDATAAVLAGAGFARVVVTDSVTSRPGFDVLTRDGHVDVTSCAGLLADALQRLHRDAPLTDLIEGADR